MRPADIDASFVPRQAEDAYTETMDGECVILDTDGNHLHHLNPSASVVWRCFDGTGSVSEIAADLAEGFGSDPAATAAEVLALTRALGAKGLLAGVVPDEVADEAAGGP